MTPLKFEEMYVGMEVVDEEGAEGVIKKIIDEHSIIVEFIENGKWAGQGIFCSVKGCYEIENDIKINMYSPLFIKEVGK